MSINQLESSKCLDEQAKIDQDDLKLKNVFDDVNELKGIINELNQDLNSNKESNKMDIINKNLNNLTDKENDNLIKSNIDDNYLNNKNLLNKEPNKETEYFNSNNIDKQINNSIASSELDNDFELISSNDQLDNCELDSNILNLDSNISSNSDKIIYTNQSDQLSNTKIESDMRVNQQFHQKLSSQSNDYLNKRNSQQNLKENLKESIKNKENKLKLFHHKSAEFNEKRQTWQKQLLQTPFFKSFNTQQLLSHYGKNGNNLQNLELPDKILNQDDSDSDEPLLSGSGEVPKECSDELIQSWSVILKKWNPPTRPPGLERLIKFGIPETLRGQVWQFLVETKEDHAIIETYRILINKESEFELNIQRDINRTFPANDYFKNSSCGQDNLYKLCKAYSIFDEEIGYVQGLTFIGAALLLHMPEEQAFVVLVRIMHDYGVRDLFKSSFENLHLRFYQLDRLIEEQLPELYQHFNNISLESHMFASNWILTLFTSKFPLHLVYYILDLFLFNKFNTIFQVSIALLSLSSSELLQLDFEETLKYFRVHLPKKYRSDANAKYLLKTAFNVKLKKLDKYEKDYKQFQEIQESKKDPLQRLKEENQRLHNSVFRLEQENDQLAAEISSSKLKMRAQLDISEDKVEYLSNELIRKEKYLEELEEDKKLLLLEASNLKEICRRELESVELKSDQREKINNEYKEICSNLSKRLEDEEIKLKELNQIILNCSHCSQLIKIDNLNNESNDSVSSGKSILESLRKNSNPEENDEIKLLEKRIHDLEIELAQTKLELVETKCNNQTLQHKLNSR